MCSLHLCSCPSLDNENKLWNISISFSVLQLFSPRVSESSSHSQCAILESLAERELGQSRDCSARAICHVQRARIARAWSPRESSAVD